jgi:hypothetical protein
VFGLAAVEARGMRSSLKVKQVPHVRNFSYFPFPGHLSRSTAPPLKPLCKLSELYRVLDLHIPNGNAYRVQSSCNAFDPLISLKLSKAQRDAL